MVERSHGAHLNDFRVINKDFTMPPGQSGLDTDSDINTISSPIYPGQQIDLPGGGLGFWYPNSWSGNPGIPSAGVIPGITQNGTEGFAVDRGAFQAAHPDNSLFTNNEFGDFLKTAGMVFGGADLLTGGIPGLFSSAGTYGDGLMSGAEGGFDVGMGGGTNAALGLGASPSSSSAFSSLFGGSPGDIWQKLLKAKLGSTAGPLSTIFNAGSGIYGLIKSQQMSKLAQSAAAMNDPFGPNRAGYAAQLKDLMANPGSIAGRPDFLQGQQALVRQLASRGYLGSGNMATGLLDYANKYYGDEVSRLGSLAGAGFAPNGGNALIAGSTASNDLASRALASLGFSLRGFEDIFK